MDPGHRRTTGGVPVGLTGGIDFMKSDSPGRASRYGSGRARGALFVQMDESPLPSHVRIWRYLYRHTFAYCGKSGGFTFV